MNNKLTGIKVKRLRKRLEMTQAQFAKKLGVTKFWISKIEHEHVPIGKPLEIICGLLAAGLRGRPIFPLPVLPSDR